MLQGWGEMFAELCWGAGRLWKGNQELGQHPRAVGAAAAASGTLGCIPNVETQIPSRLFWGTPRKK